MSLLTVKRSFVVRIGTNAPPSNVICRICRKQCTARDQISLFKNGSLRANASMLALIADVKVMFNDKLPKVICWPCNNILEKAYVLRNIAQNSDKIFRTLRQKKGYITKDDEESPTEISKSPTKASKPQAHVLRIKTEDGNGTFTDNDDIFSDMNQPDDQKDNTEIDTHDDGFSQDEIFQDMDSDPDYNPQDEAPDLEEEEKPKQSAFVKRHHTSNPRAKAKLKPKPQIKASDIKKFLMLKKQHELQEQQRKLLNAERKFRKKIERKKIARTTTARISQPAKPSLCSLCGTLAKNMNAHLRQHQEKTFKCELCPKAYKSQSHLNAHMKKHRGERDFKCDLCEAAFFEKKGLVRHMLMHTQTRPYSCKICGKSFSYSNVLRNHMDIHLNRKPHTCEVCDRPFRTKKHLKTHMIIHTGERPWQCQICNTSFAYKVNLNQHMARVHGVNWKYKSIPIVTESVLEEERAKDALKAIIPYIQDNQQEHESLNEIVITTTGSAKDEIEIDDE